MEVKAGYKQTEVGVIPEEWEVKPLLLIADKVMVGIASAATHAYRTKGVPLLRNQNIKVGYLDDGDILFVDPEYESTFKNKRLRSGDLLTARTGYPGITCIVPPHFESAQSFTTLITRPRTREIDSPYLCHFINSEVGQKFFEQGQIGGAQKNVNVATLRRMPIPVPPLPEQRAIAGALSEVDALIGALDQLIAKKRDLKQAAMQQLLTGQTRLPGFHGEWECSTVGREFEIKLGKMLDSERNHGVPKPFLGNKAVQWDRIDISDLSTVPMSLADLERYRLERGDLLVCEGGEVGRAAIWEAPMAECYYQKALHRLRPLRGFDSSLMVAFLRYWSDQGMLTNYVTQTSIAHLTREKLAEVPMRVPQPAEQTAIAAVLSDMDAELAVLEQRRDKTRSLKQGMMQELLTGRIRLR